MSDSSLLESRLSEGEMEQALRRVVQLAHSKGDLESITVKRMRKAAEEDLHLPLDFFKRDLQWEAKSKRIIKDEAEAQADAAERRDTASSQSTTQNAISKASPKIAGLPPKTSNKRSSPVQSEPKKRQKIMEEPDLDNSASQDLAKTTSKRRSKPKLPSQKAHVKTVLAKSSDDETQKPSEIKDEENLPAPNEAGTDSEMSEVLDDEPKPKPKKRRSGSGEHKVKAATKPREKKRREQESDPDKEEIKRLQGWLVKCGVRKMWHRELAPYNNPKARIRHLKEMLSEVGMAGRYSADKAAQIREARELKSELEAVQAGAKHWGKSDSEAESEARPKRRLARGLQNLEFLNDDDGEETD